MELNAMRKKRVWKTGCAVFLILAMCTVFSSVIQKVMSISVWTMRAEIYDESGSKQLELPKGCVYETDTGPAVFLVKKKEGIFRQEWEVEEEMIMILDESEREVIVQGDLLEGKDIVYYSSWPLMAGETVRRGE